MRGQIFPLERIRRVDPRSGVLVWQLTSQPRPSFHLYFEHNHFTPDCKTVIFTRQRDTAAGSPRDVFRCDIDGRNMAQLTDEDGVYGIALSRDGRYVYYMHQATLKRVAMDTFEVDEILHVPDWGPPGVNQAGQTWDGRYYFVTMRRGEESGLFRMATDGSGAQLLCSAPRLNHVVCSPGHDVVSFGGTINGRSRHWLIDAEGGQPREFPMQRFAHASWLGRTRRVQGCLLPPGRAIMSMAEGDERPEIIVAGPYYWHSGASLDGQWIVADTNWPDEGLQLVYLPTRCVTLLCDAHATGGEAWGSHAEPALSPDGTAVMFQSNATGTAQVCVAVVPPELREAMCRATDWEGGPEPGPHYMPRMRWGLV